MPVHCEVFPRTLSQLIVEVESLESATWNLRRLSSV